MKAVICPLGLIVQERCLYAYKEIIVFPLHFFIVLIQRKVRE